MAISSAAILRVLFVCKGSVTDGLGHVMRSRTVAQQMALSSAIRIVVIGDSYVEALLAGRGLHYHIVQNEQDVLPLAQEFDPHVVVFDMLSLKEEVFPKLKGQAVGVSLSPIFNCLGKVDLIFHRTQYQGDDWNFLEGTTEMRPEIRAGLNYSIIRQQCQPISVADYEQNLAHSPFSIAISMGGSDAGNRTLQVLRSIEQLPFSMLVWVLLGEGYTHSYQELVDTVHHDHKHEIILAKTGDSMWRVVKTCAMLVLAGGTITYEAAYMGIPSINTFDKEEHVFLVRELVEGGACISAGFPFNDALSVINANILHLRSNPDKLLDMHLKARSLITESGTPRIAREIEQFARQRLCGGDFRTRNNNGTNNGTNDGNSNGTNDGNSNATNDGNSNATHTGSNNGMTNSNSIT